MKKVVCTVGTSISGGFEPDEGLLRQKIKERLSSFDPTAKETSSKASAEVNSISRLKLEDKDSILLLASDTLEGPVCSSALCEFIKKSPLLPSLDVQIKTVKGLQANDAKRFREEGVKNLAGILLQEVETARTLGTELILNPTGGFKGVTPFLTVFGMLFSLKTVYIFERSNSLISLPPLPFTFNSDIFLRAQKAIDFIQEESFIPKRKFFKMIEDFKTGEEPLFESFLEKVDSKGYEETVTLSPLAFMLCGMDDFDKASIHLEESLYKKLTGSVSEERELVELWIKRLASSLWRSSHLHSFNGADLSIFKPGNTSDRAACIIKGEKVYLCAIAMHDEYERKFGKLKEQQFDLSSFIEV